MKQIPTLFTGCLGMACGVSSWALTSNGNSAEWNIGVKTESYICGFCFTHSWNASFRWADVSWKMNLAAAASCEFPTVGAPSTHGGPDSSLAQAEPKWWSLHGHTGEVGVGHLEGCKSYQDPPVKKTRPRWLDDGHVEWSVIIKNTQNLYGICKQGQFFFQWILSLLLG